MIFIDTGGGQRVGAGWAGPSVVALGYASSGPARALTIRPELWALTVAKYEYGLSLGWIDSFFFPVLSLGPGKEQGSCPSSGRKLFMYLLMFEICANIFYHRI